MRWLRRVLLWSALFWVGLLAGFGLGWLAHNRPRPTMSGSVPVSSDVVTFTLSGTIDGADQFIFTPAGASNVHTHWSAPRNVFFNGAPWEDLSQAPLGWLELSRNLDLGRAAILTRTGRDVIALEHTVEGFDIYFADTVMGAGPYEVTVSIPKK